MAIVMMTFDIDMPGRPRQTWYAHDRATLFNVAVVAYETLIHCVHEWGQAGWTSGGKSWLKLHPEAGYLHCVEAG